MNRLILGGAKSGKSLFAETLALRSQKELVYIATAQAHDDEMKQRIKTHQQRRLNQHLKWINREEPIALSSVIQQESSNNRLILIDCLTLWLSNLLSGLSEKQRQAEIDDLFECIVNCSSDLIFVSNETGLGIVPMNQLSRQFIDLSGSLHQRMAQVSDCVIMTIAGLPLVLKGRI